MKTFLISAIGASVGLTLTWLLLRERWRALWPESARRELAAKEQELAKFIREARTDLLTGLRNRRSFDEELRRLFSQRQRQGIVFSLIMLDVDGLKEFNDRSGHLAGDAVLRSVAQVLSATLREMDLVCRFGGDEFAVICPGSRIHEAAVAAERIRQAISAAPVQLPTGPMPVTVSVGVAEVDSTEVAEGLIQRADEALYAAKKAGRNRVHRHDGPGRVADSLA